MNMIAAGGLDIAGSLIGAESARKGSSADRDWETIIMFL